MKLLGIFISFALVGVSVAENSADKYLKQVVVTNKYIQSAGAYMLVVIASINRQGYTIVEMCIMFSVPVFSIKIEYQQFVQSQIMSIAGLGELQMNEDDFRTANLRDLGNTRRRLTLPAIKKLLHFIESGNVPGHTSFFNTCRLITLFRAIEQPDLFIDSAINDDTNCYIKAVNTILFTYSYFDGNLYQTNGDGDPTEALIHQVE